MHLLGSWSLIRTKCSPTGSLAHRSKMIACFWRHGISSRLRRISPSTGVDGFKIAPPRAPRFRRKVSAASRTDPRRHALHAAHSAAGGGGFPRQACARLPRIEIRIRLRGPAQARAGGWCAMSFPAPLRRRTARLERRPRSKRSGSRFPQVPSARRRSMEARALRLVEEWMLMSW